MTPKLYRAYFEDETPRIPCGWRTISVKFGRKWVYITDVASGKKARLERDTALKIIGELADAAG